MPETLNRIRYRLSMYDFLGFSIRRYRNGKLLIKPSKAAVRRVEHKLAEQVRRLRGQNISPS